MKKLYRVEQPSCFGDEAVMRENTNKIIRSAKKIFVWVFSTDSYVEVSKSKMLALSAERYGALAFWTDEDPTNLYVEGG